MLQGWQVGKIIRKHCKKVAKCLRVLLRRSGRYECLYCPDVRTQLTTLQRHNTENLKQLFPGKKLRGYSPNSYIHVSVSNLNISLIDLPVLLQECGN
jgi:hypothetical protein